jgi:hypothetical protein
MGWILVGWMLGFAKACLFNIDGVVSAVWRGDIGVGGRR